MGIMFQGQCSFSGFMVPRGSGVHKVCNDGKVIFTISRRARNFIDAKVSARDVKWTESSRAFYKKTNNNAKKDEVVYAITKRVRGFTLIPRKVVEQQMKNAPAKTEAKNSQKQT